MRDDIARRTFIATLGAALGAAAWLSAPKVLRPPERPDAPSPASPSADAEQPQPRLVDRLTVHHSATGSVASDGSRIDVGFIADGHRERGLGMGFDDHRAAAYHFLILPDGTIQAGRPLDLRSSGTRSSTDNHRCVAVCLIGDFESSANPVRGGRALHWPPVPTRSQTKALKRVALWAMDTYGFGAEEVRGHREVSVSDCPGDRFDLRALRRSLRTLRRAGDRGTPPPGATAGVMPAGTRAADGRASAAG